MKRSWNCGFVCLFANSSRTYTLTCTKLGMLIPWDPDENIAQNSGKVSWDRFPMRVVLVARKLSTTEERRLEQSCLFRRGDYINKDQNPEKLSWVRFPVKMVSVARILSMMSQRRTVLGSSPDEVLCSSKTKYKRRAAPMQNFFAPERILQELRTETRKLSWVRDSVKILSLGITIREPRDDIRHDTYEPTTRAPTIGVATPTQDAIFCADEPRNATRHDADKPTPSVETPIFATQTSIPNQAKRSIETPYDAILTNRHRASRRRLKIHYPRETTRHNRAIQWCMFIDFRKIQNYGVVILCIM
jgi:hypothetical protein